MSDKPRSNFKELRGALEQTAEKKLSLSISDIYGIELPPTVIFSASEQVRAQENKKFGKKVCEAFRWLVQNDVITRDELLRKTNQILEQVSALQKVKVEKIFEDLFNLFNLAHSETPGQGEEKARAFLKKGLGISDKDQEDISITITSFGAIKVRVGSPAVWEKVIRRLGADPQDASKTGGFVLSPPHYASAEMKREHLQERGRYIFLNQSYKDLEQKQVESHETTHWFNHQVLAGHEKPRYKNQEANEFFVEVKDELLAYASSELFQSSLSRLVRRGESGKAAFTRFTESLRRQAEEEIKLKKMIEANLVPADHNRLWLSQKDLDEVFEQHRQKTGKGRADIRQIARRCNIEASDESRHAESEAAMELALCLRQIARLDVQNSLNFKEILPAIIGAQTFKELTFLLHEIDQNNDPYDVEAEFGKTAIEDMNLARAETILVVAKKWRIPIKNVEVLVAKLAERLDKLLQTENCSDEQKTEKETIKDLLEYFNKK